MFDTQITRMFGVKYPVICGAMMWLCKPKMCAAVSNAGGIGNLTAGNYETADEFRAAIRETRRLTDKPFFVAITLLPSVRITPVVLDTDSKTASSANSSSIASTSLSL